MKLHGQPVYALSLQYFAVIRAVGDAVGYADGDVSTTAKEWTWLESE